MKSFKSIVQDIGVVLINKTNSTITQLTFNKIAPALRELKYKIKPAERGPIYTFGSADPRAFAHDNYCFSGIDIKVYLLKPEDDLEEVIVIDDKSAIVKHGAIASVQEVRFWDAVDTHCGKMKFVVFDDLKQVESFAGQKMRLIMNAANEYGACVTLIDKIILFNKYYDWKISIDDVVTDVNIGFVVIQSEAQDETN